MEGGWELSFLSSSFSEGWRGEEEDAVVEMGGDEDCGEDGGREDAWEEDRSDVRGPSQVSEGRWESCDEHSLEEEGVEEFSPEEERAG